MGLGRYSMIATFNSNETLFEKALLAGEVYEEEGLCYQRQRMKDTLLHSNCSRSTHDVGIVNACLVPFLFQHTIAPFR